MSEVSGAKSLELPNSSTVPNKSTDFYQYGASKASSWKYNNTRSSRSSTHGSASRLKAVRVKSELARLTKIENEEKLREEEISAVEAELERQKERRMRK